MSATMAQLIKTFGTAPLTDEEMLHVPKSGFIDVYPLDEWHNGYLDLSDGPRICEAPICQRIEHPTTHRRFTGEPWCVHAMMAEQWWLESGRTWVRPKGQRKGLSKAATAPGCVRVEGGPLNNQQIVMSWRMPTGTKAKPVWGGPKSWVNLTTLFVVECEDQGGKFLHGTFEIVNRLPLLGCYTLTDDLRYLWTPELLEGTPYGTSDRDSPAGQWAARSEQT